MADDILDIQRALVNHERAKQIATQQKLAKDIRSQIARSGQYNPESDPVYEYVEFPKWARITIDGKLIEKIVNTKSEENEFLGIKEAPAKQATVDIAALAQPEIAKAKRGRPPKAASIDLPANLE